MKGTVWKAAVVAVMVLSSVTLCAQDRTGPYVGVLGGSTSIKDNGLDFSTDKSTWGAFAGWQLSPVVGVELGYLSVSKITEDVVIQGSTVDLGIKASAITGSVIGTYPLGEVWSIHGRLGAARAKLKGTATNGTASAAASDYNTELIYGAGLGAMFEGARMRLEYQRIDADGTEFGLISLGIVWYLGR